MMGKPQCNALDCNIILLLDTAIVMMVAFFWLARIWGEYSTVHSLPALFCFLFFWKWRLTCAHEFHSLCQDQSTVAQRAQTTVHGRMFPDKVAC